MGGGDDLGLVHDETAARVHGFVVGVDRLHVRHPRHVLRALGASVDLTVVAWLISTGRFFVAAWFLVATWFFLAIGSGPRPT